MASRKVKTETTTARAGGRTTKKAEVRVVDEAGIEEVKGGMSLDDGIVLTTTLLLVASIVFVIMQLNDRYWV